MRIHYVDFSQFLNSFYFQMWAKLRILFVHNLLYLSQLSDGLVPLQTLCEPGAEIPDDLIQCGSCENRCGSKTNPDHFVSCPDREHKYVCSCDRFCGFHGDCCHDFQKFCRNEFVGFQRISREFPFHHDAGDLGCFTFKSTSETFNNLMIHTCPDGSECEYNREISENLNTIVPMYDTLRRIHYMSRQCAFCNGATDLKPWKVFFECEFSHRVFEGSHQVDSQEKLHVVKNSNRCKLSYNIVGESRPCYENLKSTCLESCENEDVKTRCETGSSSLTNIKYNLFAFKNEYCALCNSEQSWDTVGILR